MNLPRYTYPPLPYDRRLLLCEFPKEYQQLALRDRDYEQLSKEFKVGVPEIKTVIAVESAGNGFLIKESYPARPKILLEAHWVYALTRTPVSRLRPDLSQKTWSQGRKYYKGGSGEWDRILALMEVLLLHREKPEQALLCASWGIGQVMGFNFVAAGCDTIKQFVEEAHAGEYYQARHMMNFIRSKGLIPKIRSHDWNGFAYGYNGEGYKANKYHLKLAQSFSRF